MDAFRLRPGLDPLDLRLARGEIDVDDYERLRRKLSHHHEIG
ncbi:hypothetical protein [Pseudonocardia sp. T1-2H]